MYLLAPFILQNFKKILRVDHLWGNAIFRSKMAHLSWKFFFLVQTIIIIFIYLLALFMLQNLQKFLQLIQSYEDVPFLDPKSSICFPKIIWKIIHIILIDLSLCKIWAQNGPFSQMRIFLENLLMSLVSFIHVYLHAKKKKKIKVRY